MMLNPNGFKYTAPVDDLWFSVHDKVEVPDQLRPAAVWIPDYLINMLGCIDQYQICNPRKPGESGCTKLSSAYKIHREFLDNVSLFNNNMPGMTTFVRFVW